MQLDEDEAERLIEEGLEALRQGRASEARTRFEKLTASGSTRELPWLLLASSRGADGDAPGEEAAINRLIELQPQSVLAHVRKGDCRARAGDRDLSCYFYRSALRFAEGKQLPQDVMAELARAEQVLADLQGRTHAAREARLAARGLPPQKWSPRFRHSLELAAGRTKPELGPESREHYLQQPTAFDYQGLPQIPYYDPGQFSWAPEVEAAAASIREELVALLEEGTDEFRAYIQADNATVPLQANKALLNSKDWSVLSLCEQGWVAPEVVKRCPRTWEAVLKLPLPRISGWGPTVVFSMLKAGAHIAPHTGMYNTRLICHLPLIVPPGCRFRVGDEVREWQQGKLLIFDDTIEHEAWNDGPDDRIILIFDIWRPELTDQEKYELTALFSD